MQSRTHTCGELRLEHVGQQVQLAGWMENVREVGASLAFVVVRDFYGKTQLVIQDETLIRQIKSINKESTVSVTGTVVSVQARTRISPPATLKSFPTALRFWGSAGITSCRLKLTAAVKRMKRSA